MEPTTRSRTLLFVSYRDSTPRTARTPSTNAFYPDDADDDEHDRLIPAGPSSPSRSSHVALDVDLPPPWVDVSDQVQDILATTQTKISTLDKLHAKHVLPGFADRSLEEREIESRTTDITRDFRRCQSLIQGISASKNTHAFPPKKGQRPTRHEELAAQNVQRALAAKVQELSATFRKKQRVYLETLQGHAIKNQDLLVASGAVQPAIGGSEAMTELYEDVKIASRGQNTQLLYDQELEEVPDVDLQQRDREITEIARSIGQLAELFKEMSALVIDQGTVLDSIEYNIEQTAVEMHDAVKELKMAEGYQKNTGRRKCIFLLLLIIFGLIIVLIFKPRRHSSSSSSLPSSASTSVPSSMNEKVEEDGQLPPLPLISLSPQPISRVMRNRMIRREEATAANDYWENMERLISVLGYSHSK
ncbi:t-SNARE [Pyrrhoderma noxium]|uniref:t-SNARE n=1 Tax=Pyrrhoderma noxium TaxID=2282107 RepID=A0A286UGN5_9AGAM|nr:t-SNARE [Pyrrhoderma noxium]